MFPITAASRARTCLRQQSQHHIRPRGPSPTSPDFPISYHLPEGKQIGPRHIPPLAAPRRPGPWAAAPLPFGPRRKAPLLCAPRALPGGFAYLVAAPSASEAARACWGAGGARWESGRPSAASRAPMAALQPRGRAAGVSGPGLSAASWEPRIRFSFTTTSPRHRNPTGGRSRRGGAGAWLLLATVGSGRGARGAGLGGPRAARLHLLVSLLRRRGAEEPVLPKANRKWVTERPGQR
ncbi:uncharacterized protein LOC144579681 [Callithrix jacchus]